MDGVTYRKKSRLTTILVMGVDHDTQDSYEYRKAGQADFLRLVVLDDADKTVQQLQIDRDTITPVTVLGLLGDRYEPVTQQICLGYAFGDGRQTSCEVTVEAVENLLGRPGDRPVPCHGAGRHLHPERSGRRCDRDAGG